MAAWRGGSTGPRPLAGQPQKPTAAAHSRAQAPEQSTQASKGEGEEGGRQDRVQVPLQQLLQGKQGALLFGLLSHSPHGQKSPLIPDKANEAVGGKMAFSTLVLGELNTH